MGQGIGGTQADSQLRQGTAVQGLVSIMEQNLGETLSADQTKTLWEVSSILEKLGPLAEETGPLLARFFRLGGSALAASALARVAPETAKEVLLDCSLDPGCRGFPDSGLTVLGPRIVPDIREWLDGSDIRLMKSALHVLGEMGASSVAAIPQVMRTINHGDKEVRRWSAMALGRIGYPALQSAEALELLSRKDPDATVRRAALDALIAIREAWEKGIGTCFLIEKVSKIP
ncbi:MAG: HEAT repeat domain-containing protein [Pseudomonadota bacterium]